MTTEIIAEVEERAASAQQFLRKRLAAAKTDADRDRYTAKLHKLAVGSPGQPLLK